ncbi:MAG: AMP-binding protein [Actinobacteria bacterium]|nr:AMP-binding protein [Actinomycetota bacterium]
MGVSVESEDRWALRRVPGELASRYISSGSWEDRTVGDLIDSCLGSDPSRTIRIWSKTHPFNGTAGEVYELARKLAGALVSIGIGAGDVVAFQLPNWIEAAATFYGCAILGAVLVPIVHFYGSKEVKFILSQSGAKALITAERFGQHDYLSELAEIRPKLPELEQVVVVGRPPGGCHSFDGLVQEGNPLGEPAKVDPGAPALVAYTSGTTSDPKGVVHTHRSLAFEVKQLSGLQSDRNRPSLTGAPVGHGIGMLSGLLVPLYRGFPLYLTDVWDPPAVLDAMVEASISSGSGSTYFLTSLLDSPGFGSKHSALMGVIGLGGSPVPGAVADRAERLGISIVRSYGSTEHPSTTGSRHTDDAFKRTHTDGRPLDQVELRIVDDAGKDLDAGEAGEILSRGPDLFMGYTDPALTAQAIDCEGWYRTGDIGYVDCDGFLTLTDRKKDIIIRGGENVSAAEVEEALATMAGISEVAVVAAPDSRLGEHGCAFLRLSPGAKEPSLEQVREHLAKAGLARQKWPEELRVIEQMPRTPSGKIQKYVLRDRLRRGL